MNKYLITYDLKDKMRNYNSLHTAIMSLGPWWHYLESTWIVKSYLSADQLWPYLGRHISNIDRLIIVRIDTTNKSGWLPRDAWNWLDQP